MSTECVCHILNQDLGSRKLTAETKTQSKQWRQKNAKAVLSTGKVIATVSWDSHGVVLVHYLEK